MAHVAGLHRAVGELSQRRRLRPRVPPGAATTRRARQLRVPGRARGGQVAGRAPGRRSRIASASGACRTAACSRPRRSRATPTSSRPASISPACTSRAARSIRRTSRTTSSAISEIDKWKSPVLLIHGDDDRNVNFAQTVGLVQLLRARNIYHELIVFPDDVHETLLHSRWLYTFERMETFLNKFLGENASREGRQVDECRLTRSRRRSRAAAASVRTRRSSCTRDAPTALLGRLADAGEATQTSRRRRHLHHRSQRQLHERVRRAVQVLRVLSAGRIRPRATRSASTRSSGRSTRRSPSAACSCCSRAATTPTFRSAGTRICSAR